jgi:beta-glucosidase/6-phospho-beta-glucosidase/beta-galactosidase
MDHKERGIALVINIQKFDLPLAFQKPVEERVWSEKDVKSLEMTFEYLEFDFKLFKDLKASETTYRCRLFRMRGHVSW